jgi:hypothetical protein
MFGFARIGGALNHPSPRVSTDRDRGHLLCQHPAGHASGFSEESRSRMVALVVLALVLLIFGGLGFAVHVLWYVLIIAVLLWLIGFFVGGVPAGGRRRWYGRW